MKSIITSFLLLFTTLSFAQDFQGKAYYQTKTAVDADEWFGGRDIPEDRKKMIMERMKSMFEKNHVLTFNKTESTFKEEEKLATPGSGGGFGFGRMMSSATSGKQYKNVKEATFLESRDLMGKQFLIKEPLVKLDWKMGSETKVIGKYTCFKATAIKKVDEFDIRSMRRRRPRPEEKKDSVTTDSIADKDPMSEIETPKTIEVTAWYTPQIPVNQGPDKYWGLPGLILEVNADKTTILCSKIVMNPDDKEKIEAPSKGKEVTTKEYNEIVKKKMEEMREMYRGRRGGGGRGFRH